MHREALKRDLDDKYAVIFRNYGADLEAVQKTYEKQKHNAEGAEPRPRRGRHHVGAAVASKDQEPMRAFAKNELIMFSPGAKRIVKMYNRVAQAQMTYETMWHQAWMKGVEKSKAGLRATLIVRHPGTGKLLVNFDKDIMRLIRESKFMLRLDVEVPTSAKLVLAQEDRFKSYYNRLTHLIDEHGRVVSEDCARDGGHARAARGGRGGGMTGLTDLTWTSTNIDLFLQRVHNKITSLS